MTAEIQETRARRAMTERLEPMNLEWVMNKLKAGDEVKGQWGWSKQILPFVFVYIWEFLRGSLGF